jgi:hypothetical protein
MATKAKKENASEMVYWMPGMKAPAGFILIHNFRPRTTRTRQGTDGFRAFFNKPAPGKYVVCDCGWRPELGKHHVPVDRAKE